MVKVAEEKNITKLKTEWNRLVSPDTGKIYLTYPFHLAVYKSFQLFSAVKFKKAELKYIYLKRDNSVRSILPVIIDKNQKRIGFAGEFAGAGYNDFIGGNNSDIVEIAAYLKKTYFDYRLELTDISCESRINGIFQTKVYQQNYNIPIYNGYIEWLASLTGKTRRNIKRVYKRIENAEFDVCFCIADKMNSKDIQKICSMYYKHLTEIKGEENIRLKTFIRSYYKFSPVFTGINLIDRCKVAYTTHNDKIVAFHLFYEEKNGIIIPKCSYDSEFAKYEVGSYNLLELIRTYSINPANIDLSRGYHGYKTWYGGVSYPNYCLRLYCNE